jgi:hypothetical protein
MHIARIDQQNDRSGMIDVIDQIVGLFIATAFDEGSAKNFTRIIQHHHRRMLSLPTDIDTTAERTSRSRWPQTLLQLIDHVHADLMQRPVHGPHVQALTATPRLLIES